MNDIKKKVYDYIKQYKDTDILDYNEDWESEFIDPDWFYYADDFTLNVSQREDELDTVSIVAYAIKDTDGYIETDWSNILYSEVISVEKLENI